VFVRRIETSSLKNNVVTEVALISGGFDTPFAIASGYSTTDV
jgi:hypothetical protein